MAQQKKGPKKKKFSKKKLPKKKSSREKKNAPKIFLLLAAFESEVEMNTGVVDCAILRCQKKKIFPEQIFFSL